MHQYSLHFCDADASESVGSNLILRRSLKPDPLLVALMRTKGIVKLTVDGLARLMQEHQLPARKTMTKSARIRELMRLSAVRDSLASEELGELETFLTKMDERRLKRTAKEDEDAEAEDPEDPNLCMLRCPLPRFSGSCLPKGVCVSACAANLQWVLVMLSPDRNPRICMMPIRPWMQHDRCWRKSSKTRISSGLVCFVIVQLATNTVEPRLFWTCSSCQFPFCFSPYCRMMSQRPQRAVAKRKCPRHASR